MREDLFDLPGKIAVVTGSTRGIGLAVVEQFCRAGASCVVCSEAENEVAATTSSLLTDGS